MVCTAYNWCTSFYVFCQGLGLLPFRKPPQRVRACGNSLFHIPSECHALRWSARSFSTSKGDLPQQADTSDYVRRDKGSADGYGYLPKARTCSIHKSDPGPFRRQIGNLRDANDTLMN